MLFSISSAGPLPRHRMRPASTKHSDTRDTPSEPPGGTIRTNAPPLYQCGAFAACRRSLGFEVLGALFGTSNEGEGMRSGHYLAQVTRDSELDFLRPPFGTSNEGEGFETLRPLFPIVVAGRWFRSSGSTFWHSSCRESKHD